MNNEAVRPDTIYSLIEAGIGRNGDQAVIL